MECHILQYVTIFYLFPFELYWLARRGEGNDVDSSGNHRKVFPLQ